MALMEQTLGDAIILPDLVAAALRTSKEELAQTTGLSRDALGRKTRIGRPLTQSRLREMLEILVRVEAWAGSAVAAYAWYRAQPLPGFGERTAEMLVRDGHAGAVRRYLDEVALGGFA